MADVRCPMCGQPNPDHLEECQFCQARLKPLVGGAPDQDSPQDDDWLRSLREEDDGGELPDWLENFDDEPISPEEVEPESDSGPAKQDPDPDSAGGPAGESDNPIPDWLTSLGPVEDFSAADPNLPSWLTELADSGEEQADDRLEDPAAKPEPAEPEEPAEAQPSEEYDTFSFLVDENGLPDWLAAVGAPSRQTGAGDETPPPIAEEEPVEEPAAPVEPAPDAVGGAEEPAGEEAPDLSAAEQEEPVPDWLAELESDGEEPGGEAPPPLPDWLARLAEEEEEEEEPLPLEGEEPPDVPDEPETARPADTPADPDLPPWLSEFEEMIGDEDAPREIGEEHVETPGGPAEKNDEAWLAGFVDEDETASEEEPADPDWLSGFISEETDPEPEQADEEMDDEVPEQPAEEAADTIAADAVPDWLMAALEQGEKEGEASVEEDADEEEAPADAFSAPLPGAEEDLEPELEAWLSSFTMEEEQVEESEEAESPDWLVEAGAPLSAESSAGEEVPDWLQDLQDRSLTENLVDSEEWRMDAGLEEPGEPEEPDSGELQPSEEELTLAALTGGEANEDDLSPGDIPDWLKAMEPAETPPAADEPMPAETGSIERVGPLAGMRGLLSAEPVAAQAGRPPAQFVRLQISDLQQRRADQLQKMVQAETAPSTPDRDAGLTDQKVLRYLIAAVLFLVALVPTLLPGPLSALPPRPAEMERLNALIMGLTADSNVLVATDYQAGMSGEMDAASAAVLDHLMIQRAKLALVSTQATGPAIGERLVRGVSLTHGYSYGTEYVNLGYLAGDSTGLRSFAAAPQKTLVIGYDSLPLWRLLDSGTSLSPWSQPALQGVTGLADFDLTVLISDDPDGIRRWIEQVSPALRPNSLVVIASAQAAPIVRPYVDVNQGPVAALVSGVPGGAAYEGFLQREGPARAAWDAFSLATLIAVVLVLGAGSYNLYLAWRIRENARKGRS